MLGEELLRAVVGMGGWEVTALLLLVLLLPLLLLLKLGMNRLDGGMDPTSSDLAPPSAPGAGDLVPPLLCGIFLGVEGKNRFLLEGLDGTTPLASVAMSLLLPPADALAACCPSSAKASW